MTLQKAAENRPAGRGSHFARWAVAVFLLLALSGGGFFYWWQHRYWETTDNAYVAGNVAVISPRVPGRVLEVLVADNRAVRPGDPLVRLDPRDYEIAVQEAAAALARIQDEVRARYHAVAKARAKLAQAEANLKKAQTDKWRYTNLFARQTVPREALDRVLTAYRVSAATVAEAKAELQLALATLGGSTDLPPDQQPAVLEAKARLEQARLRLQYTVITAPIAGYVTRKAVEAGNWVQPGQALMAVVPLSPPDIWVEANFKETQLTHVRIGQPVHLKVDTYPGVKFYGVVDSIMAGTGAAFALLPPENATGNWVKVVQRIPVKIRLEPPLPEDKPLRLGMSVVAAVNTRDRQGPLLLPPPAAQPAAGLPAPRTTGLN